LCFDDYNGIIDEEEDLMFVNELELFFIDIISFPLKTLKTVVVSTIQTKKNTKTTMLEHNPLIISKVVLELSLIINPKSI
jgi:hypothetical protein